MWNNYKQLNIQSRNNSDSSEEFIEDLAYYINSACKMLDNLYDINCGGCCYVAYLLAKLFIEDGYRVNLVVFDYEEEIEGTEYLFELDSCSHYCITVNDIMINENKNYDDYSSCVIPIKNPDEILRHYKRGDWNDVYNVANNSRIEKLLRNLYDTFNQDLYKKWDIPYKFSFVDRLKRIL